MGSRFGIEHEAICNALDAKDRLEAKRIERIREHAPELLAVLEELADIFEGEDGAVCGRGAEALEAARAAIRAANGGDNDTSNTVSMPLCRKAKQLSN